MNKWRTWRLLALVGFAAQFFGINADGASPIAVRGVVPRAKGAVIVDGRLQETEYAGALCTPIEYFNRDPANRAGQFFYMWDSDAFYVGLRTLDTNAFSPESPLWEGDAVEWYFDARRGREFLSSSWPKEASAGAVHCFFTAMHRDRVEPRFTLRPSFEQAIPKHGIEVAAQRTELGLEAEFKLPWSNFPQFVPRVGEVIGVDAELSYSDGGPRSYRSFVFGSPLSVQQPANLARAKLVEVFEREHWATSAAVLMPMRVDVPWNQSGTPQVVGRIALPPGRSDEVGRIVFQLTDLRGNAIGEFEAGEAQPLASEGDFAVREARWPADIAAPGTYHVQAVVFHKEGAELARIAPRLVSVNMEPGY
jgi:hypothetical protein